MNNFWSYFPEIPESDRLSAENIGSTPLIATEISGEKIYIKNEFCNRTESYKDRGMIYQLSKLTSSGFNRFVLSSSGNAAISAVDIINKLPDCRLDVFVGRNINQVKLEKLNKSAGERIKINISARPKSSAIKFAATGNLINLRPSVSTYGSKGYESIGIELAEQLPDIDAIFIPCSSGTGTLGIVAGMRRAGINPAVHICQTIKIAAIAKHFHHDFIPRDRSLADAISDRVAHLKNEVTNTVELNQGSGWIIDDAKLLEVEKMFRELDLKIPVSYNSLLSLAGYLQARAAGYEYQYPVMLFSGP